MNMNKAQVLPNVAGVLTIAYLGEKYTRRFGPRAIVSVREVIYRKRHEVLEKEHQQAVAMARLDVELRWELSVEQYANGYLEGHIIAIPGYMGPPPKEVQLAWLRDYYIGYMTEVATRSIRYRLFDIAGRRKAWRPALYKEKMVSQYDTMLARQHSEMLQVFGEEHIMASV